MQLMAEPQMAGQLVNCPGCNTKFKVPSLEALMGSEAGGQSPEAGRGSKKKQRTVWKEQDPTNPNALLSSGIGLAVTVVWFALLKILVATGLMGEKHKLMELFYKHFAISFVSTLFFAWGIAILVLKYKKLEHQRAAMLLDVLPRGLGDDIDGNNIGMFIDHVYALPEHLRDSLMVNRIRKALEFFETRQNVADVSTLMASQSGIDGARIMGSYIVVKAFLWAIPLLGFIGTVIGLSHAIEGMQFDGVEDVSKMMGTIKDVTGGLGTAFDATLLGLIFAVIMNFPLNSLNKHEEETLNDIDAFCNEVLLPRLNDGSAKAKKEIGFSDVSAMADAVVQGVTAAQHDFLTNLNDLSGRMLEYATNLETSNDRYQQAAVEAIGARFTSLDAQAVQHLEMLRDRHVEAFDAFGKNLSKSEDLSREAYENVVRSQNEAAKRLADKVEALTTGIDGMISAAAAATAKSVGSFGELVSKMETATKEHEAALRASQEKAVQALAEKMTALTASVESVVVSKFTERISAMAAGMEGSLKSSAEATERAVTGFGEYVRKMESSTAEYQSGLQASQERMAAKLGEQLGGLVSGVESSVMKHFNEKLSGLASALEGTVSASGQATERAVASFGQYVASMESSSKQYQAGLQSSQEQLAKQLVEKMGGIASGVESTIMAQFGQKLSALSSALEGTVSASGQATERAVASFGQYVASMEASSKQYQAGLQSSQEQLAKQLVEKMGGIASGVESTVMAQFGQKLSALASALEGSVSATAQSTQRAVAGFGEYVSKMEAASRDYQAGLQAAQEGVVRQLSDRVAGLVSSVENAVVAQTAQRVGVVAQSMETSIASSAQATERAVAGFGQYIGGLQAATQQYQQALQGAQQQALAQFSDQVGAVASNVQGSLMAVVQATQQSISGLDAGIRSLNAVLAQLGQQQVVIQQIAPQVSTEDAKKKGWFGR